MLFFVEVYKAAAKDELFAMANVLSFRLILSVFPFIIFIINLMTYFKVDFSLYIARYTSGIPSSVMNIFNGFIKEAVYTRRISILSWSLVIAVYSASSGFLSALRGLERAYNIPKKAGYIKSRILSMLFVICFPFIIVLSLIVMIFGDKIIAFFAQLNTFPALCIVIANKLTYFFTVFTVFVMISFFYTVGVSVRQKITEVMPGALFVVAVWTISSKIFNLYINNFSKYSVLYGSIGGIFVMAYWLYILSAVFLAGGEINAVLYQKKHSKTLKQEENYEPE